MNSKDYGKPFLQIFLEADKDFYKIDHGLFAPAVLNDKQRQDRQNLQGGTNKS